MTSEQARFEDYLEWLRGRIADRATEVSEDDPDVVFGVFREQVFTEVVRESLEELGEVGDGEVCFFERRLGRGIARVNGWSVDEDDLRLDLLTSLYRGQADLGTVPRREVETAAQRALRVFELARGGFHREMEPASASFDMMQRLHELSGAVEQIRVLVLVEGITADTKSLELQDVGIETRVEVWDLQRLYRAEASGLPYEDIEIDLVERAGAPLACLPMPGAADDYRVLLAVLPGDLIHDLYHEHGARLLELNVRSFLQARGKVNRGIRDTLLKEPDRFLAYNNGISATAHGVEFGEFGCASDGVLAMNRIRGLQIVNGGQTVASIHRAKQRDGVDLSNVFVQAKITVIKPENVESLVPFISRYANSQNRVSEADFSANHQFHVQIEHLSKTIWTPGQESRWFYERARGQYEVARSLEATTPARRRKFDLATPVRQKFDKVRLAKYVTAWNQLPHKVSLGGQKCFVAFMQGVASRGHNWIPDQEYYKRLIAKAIIFKKAESIARKQDLPAYRANAVAYTVALISYRTAGRVDLFDVWNKQDVSEAMVNTLRSWMEVVHEELIVSAEGLNVTEWCKKEACWRRIQTMELPLPLDLEAELSEGQPLPTVGPAAGRKGIDLTEADRENIARVMQQGMEGWIRIAAWGQESGALEGWQTGIATTLAGYAAGKWNRVPSGKQAKQGARILEMARAVLQDIEANID